ncbi:response regulator [Cohnella soli]|uniref:Response regulator n=1 Tax=Cohnella soli TaxID=425005 RepID=A0ABW0I1R6_9BACL
MNILIVDDEIHIREGLKRTIESSLLSMKVWTAESGEQALDTLRETSIDIVIADIMMNGMTGLELIAAGKALYKRIHWIVLSAHSDFQFAQEAIRQGARDYLLKPIGKPKLIELLARLSEEIKQEEALLSGEKLLARNLHLLREAVFQRFANGLDIGSLDLSQLAERYADFHLIMIELHEHKEASLYHFISENIMTEMVAAKEQGFVFSLDGRTIVGLLATKEKSEAFVSELKMMLDRCLKCGFDIQSSKPMNDLRDIPAVIRGMRSPSAARGAEDEGRHAEESPTSVIPIAIQYIQEHYREELSLEKVAAAVYLNAAYFSQLFKTKTGQGYKEYVTRLRMDKAAELLRHTQLKVTEVAYRAGFQDIRHFTQVFRKTYQTTPTEYRQQHQQGEA